MGEWIARSDEHSLTSSSENEDALRSLTIRDKPIQEDEGEAKEAFDTMANQLRLVRNSSKAKIKARLTIS